GLHVYRADEDAGRFNRRHQTRFPSSQRALALIPHGVIRDEAQELPQQAAIVFGIQRRYAVLRARQRVPRMTASGLPFDDFRNLLRQLPGPDETAASVVRRAFEPGGREAGALGRLEEIAVWLAAWTGRPAALPGRPLMAVFAGTHGVSTALGTPDPIAETQHRVERLAAGAAALNRLCLVNDLSLKVFDLALDMPVEDISLKAAMDERGCAATMAFGMEAVAGGTDLICIGDLGVDNDVPAAAIFAAL